MTGLYKTPEDRSFLNYYALMMFSEDKFASEHRYSLLAASAALAFVSLGLYPLFLGLFMAGEYVLEGRVTQNIDQLAEQIDRIAKSSQKHLPVTENIGIKEDLFSQLGTDIQNLIISRTGEDQNLLKQPSKTLQKQAKATPVAMWNKDLSLIKTFLTRTNNNDLWNQIDQKFKLEEKPEIFKKTDELTAFLIDELQPADLLQLKELPEFYLNREFSYDFIDLLYINEQLKKVNWKISYFTPTLQLHAQFYSHFDFLLEKGMFNKIIKEAAKIEDDRIKNEILSRTFLEAIRKNKFAAAIKACNNIQSKMNDLTVDFNQIDNYEGFKKGIDHLCSNNQFGMALKIVDAIKPELTFPLKRYLMMEIITKLCQANRFDEARSIINYLIPLPSYSHPYGGVSYSTELGLFWIQELWQKKHYDEAKNFVAKASILQAVNQNALLEFLIDKLIVENNFDEAKPLIEQMTYNTFKKRKSDTNIVYVEGEQIYNAELDFITNAYTKMGMLDKAEEMRKRKTA